MLKIKKKAVVHCNGGVNCVSCDSGCLGCGACEQACRLGAVTVGSNKIAIVDVDKCVGCGLCVKACPRGVISLRREDAPFTVNCANEDMGKKAREACSRSCVSCGMCVKACPCGAIAINDGYPVIDEDKCMSCGFCAVACPRHVIHDARGIFSID